MDKFENMRVSSQSIDSTAKVRARIKEQESLMMENERQYNEIDETNDSSIQFFPTALQDQDFNTVDPETDEIFSIGDLKLELYDQKVNRDEFEQDLHSSVRGIK